MSKKRNIEHGAPSSLFASFQDAPPTLESITTPLVTFKSLFSLKSLGGMFALSTGDSDEETIVLYDTFKDIKPLGNCLSPELVEVVRGKIYLLSLHRLADKEKKLVGLASSQLIDKDSASHHAPSATLPTTSARPFAFSASQPMSNSGGSDFGPSQPFPFTFPDSVSKQNNVDSNFKTILHALDSRTEPVDINFKVAGILK
ncbi:hypothetical protein DL96DRAFT_1712471 [Flagelloscypha sp. PMI_526]|nr:hypothetical protein DL96DRAFT_1712471 [Flagelloscypha sp. PMI_526]